MDPKHDYVGEAKTAKAGVGLPMRALQALASIRFTVVLFALSIFLIFYGTLAQKHQDIGTTLRQYFYCWVSWVDLGLTSEITKTFFNVELLKEGTTIEVPFFGGFLLGWAMVANLTAAHLVRFKLRWNRFGIIVTHMGILLLLGAEFRRATEAEEFRMSGRKGETVNKLVSFDKTELVLRIPSATAGQDEILTVPGSWIEKAGQTVDDDRLPVKIKVLEYIRNSTDPVPLPAGETPQVTAGYGQFIRINKAKDFSSAGGGGRVNLPAVVLELTDRANGQSLGSYLFGTTLELWQPIPLGNKTYKALYRLQEKTLDYSVKIEECEWEVHPGTGKAKHFASSVVVDNPKTGEKLPVYIWMNHPMYYDSMTFFQSGMDKIDGTMYTSLQVVRNPASNWPLLSCIVVTAGLLIHFVMKLVVFLVRRV
jgi:ResB-like family